MGILIMRKAGAGTLPRVKVETTATFCAGLLSLIMSATPAPAQTLDFRGGILGDTRAKVMTAPGDLSGYSRGCEGVLRTWADPHNAGKITCVILVSPVLNPLLACSVPKASAKFPTVVIQVARADLPLVHRRAHLLADILRTRGYTVVVEEKRGVH